MKEGCLIAYNAGQWDVDTTNCKIDGNAFWDCQEDMKMMDGVKTKRTVPVVFIGKLNKKAFKNPESLFYSCNTGTSENGTNFAHSWVQRFGGTTKAFVGSSYYANIDQDADPISKASRYLNGFSYSGSEHYPTGYEDAKFKTFTKGRRH